MILDVLISKYLDGELTPDEDRSLRAQVAADREAKEAFDAAVLLHIAMRCEDDEAMPEGEADRVLALVHQRMYAAEVPPVVAGPNSLRPTSARGSVGRRAGVLALIFLFCIIPIAHEGFLPSFFPFDSADRGSVPSGGVGTTVGPGTSGGPVRIAARAFAPDRVVVTAYEETTTIATMETGATVVEGCMPVSATAPTAAERPSASEPTLASRFGADLGSAQIGMGTDVLPSNDGTVTMAPPPTPRSPSTDVLLSTFYAQSFGGGTSSHGTVTQVAQSVGYATGGSTWVGLELGATSYDVSVDYSGPMATSASAAAARPGAGIASEGDGPSKFPEWVTPGGTYERALFTGTNQSRTFWGAAFVQQSLVRTSMLGLQGRAGAGAGQDGFVAYGRLQGEIHIVSSIALTIGSEARLIPFRTGASPAKDVDRTYGTIFSLLYGVQIRL